MKYVYLVTILVIIALSVLPRSIELLNHNYLFGFDQGRDYLAAKQIAIDRKPTLIGPEIGGGFAGISGLFHGPLYYYLLTLPLLAFNGDPYGSIVLMFILGTVALLLAFLLGWRLFGIYGGGLTLFLVGVSPVLISQSRFAWEPHPSTVFVILSLYTLWMISQNRKLYLFLSGFFAGLIYNFEFAIAIPMSFAVFIYALIFMKINKLSHYVYLFLGFLLAYAPMILFEFRHGFQGLLGGLTYVVADKNMSKTFLELRVEHATSLMFNFFDSFPKFSVPAPFFIYLGFLVFIFFLLKTERHKDVKRFIGFLLMLPFVTYGIFVFFNNTVYMHHLIHLNIVYALLSAYGLYRLVTSHRLAAKVTALSVVVLLVITATRGAIIMFQKDYVDYGGGAKIRGKLDAIDYIYRDANGRPFGLLIFTPPVYTYAFDYLLWWYGGKKYKFIPKAEKSGTFYLLIEPASEQPWSYKGWLETVIKTGTVVETKELPSGLIVQKRLGEEL